MDRMLNRGGMRKNNLGVGGRANRSLKTGRFWRWKNDVEAMS